MPYSHTISQLYRCFVCGPKVYRCFVCDPEDGLSTNDADMGSAAWSIVKLSKARAALAGEYDLNWDNAGPTVSFLHPVGDEEKSSAQSADAETPAKSESGEATDPGGAVVQQTADYAPGDGVHQEHHPMISPGDGEITGPPRKDLERPRTDGTEEQSSGESPVRAGGGGRSSPAVEGASRVFTIRVKQKAEQQAPVGEISATSSVPVSTAKLAKSTSKDRTTSATLVSTTQLHSLKKLIAKTRRVRFPDEGSIVSYIEFHDDEEIVGGAGASRPPPPEAIFADFANKIRERLEAEPNWTHDGDRSHDGNAAGPQDAAAAAEEEELFPKTVTNNPSAPSSDRSPSIDDPSQTASSSSFPEGEIAGEDVGPEGEVAYEDVSLQDSTSRLTETSSLGGTVVDRTGREGVDVQLAAPRVLPPLRTTAVDLRKKEVVDGIPPSRIAPVSGRQMMAALFAGQRGPAMGGSSAPPSLPGGSPLVAALDGEGTKRTALPPLAKAKGSLARPLLGGGPPPWLDPPPPNLREAGEEGEPPTEGPDSSDVDPPGSTLS